MNLLTNLIARIFFAVPFIGMGSGHLLHASVMAGMAPVPGGIFWIYFTGIALVLAGIAAITKFQGRLAMLLLAVLLLTFIVSIHIPNILKPETNMAGMMGMYKDTGLMGGALLLAGIFQREKQSDEKKEAA